MRSLGGGLANAAWNLQPEALASIPDEVKDAALGAACEESAGQYNRDSSNASNYPPLNDRRHRLQEESLSAKRRTTKKPRTGPHATEGPSGERASSVKLRRTERPYEFELVHPACARERADDLEEVHQMIDGGESEIAVDELRWLLSGCADFIEAHQLLGELALTDGDTRLARAHFGYAYDIGLKALPSEAWAGALPFRLPGNRSFLTAAKGLALCLLEIGEPARAREVGQRLLRFDPSDPLRVGPWLEQLPK